MTARKRVSFSEKRRVVERILRGQSSVAAEAYHYGTQVYQLTAWIGQVMLRNPPETNEQYISAARTLAPGADLSNEVY